MPDIHLRSADLGPDDTWRLVQWCFQNGADEFSVVCLAAASRDAPFCAASQRTLEPLSLPRAVRPHLTSRPSAPAARETRLWRLNSHALTLLKTLLPDGLFTDRHGNDDGWIEDPTFYRDRELLLGVITHEDVATLRATERELGRLRELNLLP